MAIQEDVHKFAQELDLSPTQADELLDFTIQQMLKVAKTNIPVEEITNQARQSLQYS